MKTGLKAKYIGQRWFWILIPLFLFGCDGNVSRARDGYWGHQSGYSIGEAIAFTESGSHQLQNDRTIYVDSAWVATLVSADDSLMVILSLSNEKGTYRMMPLYE
ncbi:MAG: hypothetical protein RLZZ519_3074 [Bacteroidota bacterium]|jgi:hypothetical protein